MPEAQVDDKLVMSRPVHSLRSRLPHAPAIVQRCCRGLLHNQVMPTPPREEQCCSAINTLHICQLSDRLSTPSMLAWITTLNLGLYGKRLRLGQTECVHRVQVCCG